MTELRVRPEPILAERVFEINRSDLWSVSAKVHRFLRELPSDERTVFELMIEGLSDHTLADAPDDAEIVISKRALNSLRPKFRAFVKSLPYSERAAVELTVEGSRADHEDYMEGATEPYDHWDGIVRIIVRKQVHAPRRAEESTANTATESFEHWDWITHVQVHQQR